jgi:geranylgeranyl pyrophosphate synthase
MCREAVKARVLNLPEVAGWPEMATAFERAMEQRGVIEWELPLMACQAVGGEASVAIPGGAAVACMQLSLLLVDDMLDEDPRGAYLRIGEAAAANLALAFQAAAFRVLEHVPMDAERRAALYAVLSRMALTSAFGQNLDAQNLGGEENYWKIVRAKTAPYFGAALYMGALLGQASLEIANRFYDLGLLYGEILQVSDDLLDAFEKPASPDWRLGRNNLAILYALTASHPDSARIEQLRSEVGTPQALEAAQQILVRCGAVSYCIYQLHERYQAARQLIDDVPLVDPAPIQDALLRQVRPVARLFQNLGIAIPFEIGVT